MSESIPPVFFEIAHKVAHQVHHPANVSMFVARFNLIHKKVQAFRVDQLISTF